MPPAQHPRPDLSVTAADGATDFKSCWARLERQWLLPSDPTQRVDLSVAELRVAALELFSAGAVHNAVVTQRLVDLLSASEDRVRSPQPPTPSPQMPTALDRLGGNR
jgi:hypothetical protein